MWKKNQSTSIRTTPSDLNWLDWIGIEKPDRDVLIEKARLLNVPVFKDDSERAIYERLASAEAMKINRKTVYINVFLATVALVSALVSAWAVFRS